MINIRDIARYNVELFSKRIFEIKSTPQLQKSPFWQEFKTAKAAVSVWLTITQIAKHRENEAYAKNFSHGEIAKLEGHIKIQNLDLTLKKDPDAFKEVFRWKAERSIPANQGGL